MWQIFAFGSLISFALENVIDKAAIVKNKSIDSVIATFYRSVLFSFFCLIAALFGFFGGLRFYFGWPIIGLAVLSIFSALFYTFLLKRIEIVTVGAVAYLTPVIFLIIDSFMLHTSFTFAQVIGIILLCLGGLGFTVDPKTFRIKKELSWQVWLIFLYSIVIYGAEFYTFRYLHKTTGIGEASFLLDAWLLVSLGLLMIVLIQGRVRKLFIPEDKSLLIKVSASKAIDTLGSLLLLRALSLSSASQVSAMGSFEPVILLLIALLFQVGMGFNLEEKFAGSHFSWKACAVILLCIGGWLIG